MGLVTEWSFKERNIINQYIRTNNIKMNIDGTRDDHKCRISEANDETITQIIFECPKLLRKEYKRLHD